ncbi:GntR family transcriptional regulator [Caloranaerobacter ferrireducens]|uniref:GntR family transcriptional regulator n=1 Tax=Caloranaerobacter ferrireducens TaxID=1323370 RepID=UPI00084D01F9|nr:GntR family transcriptional regulator [Caloranaerobacter ferrireducens]
MLDRYKPIPLYIQLKEELLKKIREGIWEVETQIPTEKKLMKEYNVGRATVREAISLLVKEGYVYRKKGIGTFVASKQPSLGFEPLISLTYSLKARGIKANNIVVEKKQITPDDNLLLKLRWNKSKQCFYIKRLRYVDNRPIAVEHSYFSNRFKYIEDKFDLTGSLAKIIIKDLKITIKKVEQTIILRLPNEEERNELKVNKDTLILDMDRWIYIEGTEEPFYYLKFLVPENIYSYPF